MFTFLICMWFSILTFVYRGATECIESMYCNFCVVDYLDRYSPSWKGHLTGNKYFHYSADTTHFDSRLSKLHFDGKMSSALVFDLGIIRNRYGHTKKMSPKYPLAHWEAFSHQCISWVFGKYIRSCAISSLNVRLIHRIILPFFVPFIYTLDISDGTFCHR